MNVDHLPARTTAEAANGTPNGIAIRTATVIDGARVKPAGRDHLQNALDGVAAAAALTGAAGAIGIAAEQPVGYGLAVLTAALVVVGLALRQAVNAEGRRWTYTTDTDTDPNTP